MAQCPTVNLYFVGKRNKLCLIKSIVNTKASNSYFLCQLLRTAHDCMYCAFETRSTVGPCQIPQKHVSDVFQAIMIE